MLRKAEVICRGIAAGQRAALARGVTLVESTLSRDKEQAQLVLAEVLARRRPSFDPPSQPQKSFRIGLSGAPGAGKSTFIESFGQMLLARGFRVAVLAVDPSSSVSGGSILGDKTRMANLASDSRAFIRPSPSCCTLGGVARNTQEAIILCEGAGYDVVLVETVGVGQSEVAVSDMVDMFVLIVSPGSGDELQGIKKGIVELADLVIVNKADGELETPARKTRIEYVSALKLLRSQSPVWEPKVTSVSSLHGVGMDETWEIMTEFREEMDGSRLLDEKRCRQRKKWMWAHISDRIMEKFLEDPNVAASIAEAERGVTSEEVTPGTAADKLLDIFGRR